MENYASFRATVKNYGEGRRRGEAEQKETPLESDLARPVWLWGDLRRFLEG
jgi:hypothetical protein